MAAPARNELTVIRRIVGNIEPIGATLQDIDGAALDVTGLTILFRMVLIDDGSVKVANQAGAIDVALSGQVSYSPTIANMDTAGLYAMYMIDDTTRDRLFPYDGARWQLDLRLETAA